MNSFNKLKEVFDGPACDDQVESMPPTPEYLNVPHYKECLGTKDMGLWVSYCLPSTVANGCPMNSFNKLKDVFDGPACDDQVESMPPTPEYMNVPHYKECLGTILSERCWQIAGGLYQLHSLLCKCCGKYISHV